jgi:hypothetical protein
MVKLEDYSVSEIRKIASAINKQVKIVGYSRKKKEDLIKLMREHPNLQIMEGQNKVVVKVKSIKESLMKVPKPKKPAQPKPPAPAPKKRGRKPKAPAPTALPKPAPKKRGRKKKEPFLTATKASGEVVELKERKPRKRKVVINRK